MTKQLGPSPNSKFPDKYPEKHFELLLKRYLMIFEGDRRVLLDADNDLKKGESILLDQHITSLEKVGRHFQELYRSLEESAKLPLATPSLRYQLLANLKYAYQQVQKLIRSINRSGSEALQESAKDTIQKKMIIQEILTLLTEIVKLVEAGIKP